MKKIQTRNKINKKYLWDLTKLYKSNFDWDKDLKNLEVLLKGLVVFKEKLKNQEELLNFLPLYENFLMIQENLHVYAYLSFSVDTSNEENRTRVQRLENLSSTWSAELVFIEQELSRIPPSTLKSFIKLAPELKDYQYLLEHYSRIQPHLFSEETEKILTSIDPVVSKTDTAFETFNNTNISFPEVIHKGKKIHLTHGSSSEYLESSDRELRRKVHSSLYTPYLQLKDVLANLYEGAVQGNSIKKKLRGFKSSLEGSLFFDEITQEVYSTLISSVKKNLILKHKSNFLRKKVLKLKKLEPFDLRVPLAKASVSYSYEKIIEITRKSLTILGKEYLKTYDDALKNKVVDVMESKSKRSGAFSWGSYLSRGYVFLNQTNKSSDISTFTHEMGHCLHRDFSKANQPFRYYGNPIILAEIASTANEILLYEYLIKNEKNKEKNKFFVYQYLKLIESTFFRQSMFADFEMQVHELADNGTPLTEPVLTSVYEKLLKEYHGPLLNITNEQKREWARIPHFYRPFYVFRYATSIGCAMYFISGILTGVIGAQEKYLEFLKAGSHKPPLEILKDMGVNLEKEETYDPLMKKYSELLNLFNN